MCGTGGDLSGPTDYVRADSCDASTGAGATHDATGSETTIFDIDPTSGVASPIWVNSDGTTLPAVYVEGTLGGVPNTILLVANSNAPVFDGGVAGMVSPVFLLAHLERMLTPLCFVGGDYHQ